MAANNSLNEKMLNLPLLCVEAICKFTPTSELTRLCSIAVPLPGAFWNFGLEAALKKRTPLSLRDDWPYSVLYDLCGAKVAAIKKPEALRFSPLLEFIENATFEVERSNSIDAPMDFQVVYGDAVLSHLPNVSHLELVLRDTKRHSASKDLLEPLLKRLRPQLQSFFISPFFNQSSHVRYEMTEAFSDFVAALRIDEMICLRRMVLPVTGFGFLVETSGDRSSRLLSVLAGLSSLVIGHKVDYDYDTDYNASVRLSLASALDFVSRSCKQLSQLKVEVRGTFSEYLAAFRELPCLTSLCLDVRETDLRGLTFDGRDAISSVSHLRIMLLAPYGYHGTTDGFLKIAACFPNVKSIEVVAYSGAPDPLQLATLLFDQTQLFPAAAKLGCLNPASEYSSCSNERLMQFLANPRLPEAVDLSEISFENLERDSGLLTATYCTMQSSSVKSLLLRGPVHREALPRLQGYMDLHGENTEVSAWKDRNFGAQPGINLPSEISEQTDIKIVGRKTSGNLKGDEFTIRVYHQLSKRARAGETEPDFLVL